MKEKCTHVTHVLRGMLTEGHVCVIPGSHISVTGSYSDVRTFSEEKLTRKIMTLKVRVGKHPIVVGRAPLLLCILWPMVNDP